MANSPATVMTSRIMSHSKTPLQALILRRVLPVPDGSNGSLLLPLLEPSPFCSPDYSIEHHRGTGSVARVQFPFGLGAEGFVSQARIEVRGRPVKIDDDDFFDDGDSDDADSDGVDCADDDDGVFTADGDDCDEDKL